MSAQEQLEVLLTATAFDKAGTKVGEVRQVYLDDATGRATFATVSTGIFSADAIVPLFGSRLLGGELHLTHSKAAIKDAPRFDDSEDALSPDHERDLLEHYGLEVPPLETPADGAGRDSGAAGAAAGTRAADADSAAPTTAEPGTIPARRLAAVEDPAAGTGTTPASARGAESAPAKSAAAPTSAAETTPEKRADASPQRADGASAAEPAAESRAGAESGAESGAANGTAKGAPTGAAFASPASAQAAPRDTAAQAPAPTTAPTAPAAQTGEKAAPAQPAQPARSPQSPEPTQPARSAQSTTPENTVDVRPEVPGKDSGSTSDAVKENLKKAADKATSAKPNPGDSAT